MMLHGEGSIITHWNLYVKWLVEHHQLQGVVLPLVIHLVVVECQMLLLD